MTTKTPADALPAKTKPSRLGHSRKSRGKAYWRKHIAAWERSGLSKAAYCRQHGLCANTMCTWRKRLAKATVKSEKQAFVELVRPETVPAPSASIEPLEIRFPSGCTVRVPASMPPEAVRPWLEALAQLR